jgi:predicted branched-subunit amino acid permease
MSQPPVTFTRRGVVAGFVQGQTLAPGILGFGMVFGVLAGDAKLSVLEALLMSIFVYSGSAQLAVLQGWTSEPQVLAAAATILVINARYVLYGAALRPWLGGLTGAQVYPTLFVLGDGNWALSMQRYAAGERDAGFLFGSGLVMYLPWQVGTLVGYVARSAVADPARFGLDFMLVAFAAALGIGLWRGRGDIAPALGALVVALGVSRVASIGWTIVAAGLAGAAIAFALWRPAR